MFKPILLVVAVVLTIVVFAHYFRLRYDRVPSPTAMSAAADQAAGAKFERMGVMPATDLVRMTTIGERTDKTGVMSDDDVDYLIQKIEDPSLMSTSSGFVHMRAAADFTSIVEYGPGQKEKIIKACIPLIVSKNQLDERVGLAVAAYQRDPRAVPYAIPLLHSSVQKVRARAAAYLIAVGRLKPAPR